jgi:tRNA 2-selenouridine synthase SelU
LQHIKPDNEVKKLERRLLYMNHKNQPITNLVKSVLEHQKLTCQRCKLPQCLRND